MQPFKVIIDLYIELIRDGPFHFFLGGVGAGKFQKKIPAQQKKRKNVFVKGQGKKKQASLLIRFC